MKLRRISPAHRENLPGPPRAAPRQEMCQLFPHGPLDSRKGMIRNIASAQQARRIGKVQDMRTGVRDSRVESTFDSKKERKAVALGRMGLKITREPCGFGPLVVRPPQFNDIHGALRHFGHADFVKIADKLNPAATIRHVMRQRDDVALDPPVSALDQVGKKNKLSSSGHAFHQ
ncbi:MAG: hypothetical protein ACREKL_13180 [Chthoniobacterales bacterium]